MPARACRGCLATDVRLRNIYKNNLYEDFGEIVGSPIFESDDLPQHICPLCYAQLRRYITFRNRVRMVQNMLEDLPHKGIQPTTAYIKTIDRKKLKLHVNLNASKIFTLELEATFADPALEVTVDKTPKESEPISKVPAPLLSKSSEVSDVAIPVTRANLNMRANAMDRPETNESLGTATELNLEVTKRPADSDETGYGFEPLDPWSPESKADNDGQFDQPTAPTKTEPTPIKEAKRRANPILKCKTANTERLRLEKCKEYNMEIISLTKEQQIEEVMEKVKQAAAMASENGFPYCSECGKRTATLDFLERHMRMFHEESVGLACEICRCRFPEDKLQAHMDLHRFRIVCKECGHVSKTYVLALKHAREHGFAPPAPEKNSRYQCPVCKEELEKRALLHSHIAEKHPEKMYWCKYCGEMGFLDTGIVSHVKRVHRNILESKHACLNCMQPFASKEALVTHQGLTCDGFNCQVCGVHLETEDLLKEHVMLSHAKWKFVNLVLCSGCGVKFFGADALARHQDGGKCGTSTNPCLECGEMFADVSSLAIHKADFHKILIRACETCDIALEPKSYRNHMLRVHNIKVEVVKTALPRPTTRVWSVHGGLITSSDLSEFKPTPSKDEEKPFMCSMCGKSFKVRSYLKKHEALHTGQSKRFNCDVCGKGFNSKSLFKNHIMVHTGEKPYACKFCPRRFRNMTPWRNHTKTHLNMRPHICHVCGKKFRTSTCVKTHIKAVHLNLPTRGPKKWEWDRLQRLEQGIVDDDTQGQTQENIARPMNDSDEIQVALSHIGVGNEDPIHVDETQGESLNKEHMEKSQGHNNQSHNITHTDNSDINTVIPPEGYIHSDTGFRIYPIKEHKIHFKTRGPTDVVNDQHKNDGVRKRLRNIDVESNESETGDYCIEETPRVIKTIHINRKKRPVNPAQIRSRNPEAHTQDNTNTDNMNETRLHRGENTGYVAKHTQDYMNTNTDYIDIDTHDQDEQNNTLHIDDEPGVIFNTLSRDDAITRVHKKKYVEKVRKVKGKSMPILDLDDRKNTAYMNTNANEIADNTLEDDVEVKNPSNTSAYRVINRNDVNSVPSHSKHVSLSKQKHILYANVTEKGKKKYVIVAKRK